VKPRWHYHVLPDGRVEVTEEGSGRVFVPELQGMERATFRVHIHERFFAIIAMHARRVGLPPEGVEGAIRAENELGDPAKGEVGGGRGIGLGQLTHRSAKAGYTDEQLKNPDLNIRLTCEHLARGAVWLRQNGYPVDVVHLVAVYNAGSIRRADDKNPEVAAKAAKSVWRIFTHDCDTLPAEREHISRAVLASNTAITLLRGPPDPSVPREIPDDELTPVTIDREAIDAQTDTDLRTITASEIGRAFRGHGRDTEPPDDAA
jgi:hypothetical protein